MEVHNITSIKRKDGEITLAGAKFKKNIGLPAEENHVHLSIDKSALNYDKNPNAIEFGSHDFSIDLGLTGLTMSCKKLTTEKSGQGTKNDMFCVLKEGITPEKPEKVKAVKPKKPKKMPTSFCEVL